MSENNYTVRLASADELFLLQEIEIASDKLFTEIGLDRVAESEPLSIDLLRSLQSDELIWVAADENDCPVGFIATRELEGMLHIEQISVHPAHGRRGLGKRLIETSCDRARIQGYPAVTLSTFLDVPWNSPFYSRIGFRALEVSEMSEEGAALFEKERNDWFPLERVCMRLDLSTQTSTREDDV